MDVPALRRLLLSESIGDGGGRRTGNESLGALDPLPEILELQADFGFRIHVDAAYGGFFKLIAADPDLRMQSQIMNLINRSDSIVVDPHKHGLQPYGCGCILFSDPSVGRFYRHDSPYTYFTSKDLHLGEISLECSRPGASAAALWFTLQCLPLQADSGLGAVLRQCRLAALYWAALIRTSDTLSLYVEPELDIVTYFAGDTGSRCSEISAMNERVFRMANSA